MILNGIYNPQCALMKNGAAIREMLNARRLVPRIRLKCLTMAVEIASIYFGVVR